MRISTGMIYDSGLSSMQNRTSTLLRTQQQLSSGRRLLNPSDDPVAAARALEVTQSQAVNGAQGNSRDNVKSTVGLADAQLQSASNLLARVRELTVQGANATLSDTDRRSVAQELRQRFDELLAIANAKDGLGNSLFGGFQVGNKPFAGSVEDGVNYVGDDGQRALQVSNARLMGISQAGSDIFMRVKTGNGTFVTATQNEKPANTGTAIIDKGSVTDPVKWSQTGNSGNLEIRFTGAATFDIYDASTNTALTTGVAYTSGSAISLPGGALDYGAEVTISGTPANGDVFTIQSSTDYTGNGYFVTAEKTVTQYNTGTGIIGAGEVLNEAKWNHPANSRNLEVRFWQDPTTSMTYYDLVDAENGNSLFTGTRSTSGAGGTFTHAFNAGNPIPFSGLNVAWAGPPATTVTDFGVSVTLDGTPASGDAFKIRASDNKSIFATLATTIQSLESSKPTGTQGNIQISNDLGGVLTNLSRAEDAILTARAIFGTNLSEVDSLDSVGQDLDIQYSDTLSRLQDLDYAEAITKLNRQQMELQAAQQSFTRISQLSLFDYIR